MTTYLKAGAVLLLIALVLGVLFGAYQHGVTVVDEKWQSEWNARDAEAKALNEAAERDKEPARQQSINTVIQNGRQIIDQATADAATLASQPVKPAATAALPPQARQLPATLLCLPTCSSALTSERAIWLKLLTKPEPGE
jgi:hypothetical protein